MIRVFNKFEPIPHNFVEVDTTSRGSFKDLSPFYLGPYTWYDATVSREVTANVMENIWQYSKVYPQHATPDDGDLTFSRDPIDDWFQWRAAGFANPRAVRYPMGKGAKPLYSVWNNHKYGVVDARRMIYIPVYSYLVIRTKSYAMLYNWVSQGRDIALRDFDGYDHQALHMTLRDVINNPKRSMGHAFVIYGLLTGELRKCLPKQDFQL